MLVLGVRGEAVCILCPALMSGLGRFGAPFSGGFLFSNKGERDKQSDSESWSALWGLRNPRQSSPSGAVMAPRASGGCSM